MKTNQPNRGRRRAFTRGDLLIMVALVLLLVAVQLPSFGKAQSGSQAGTCANNLRRLIQAWGMAAYCISGTAASLPAPTASWCIAIYIANVWSTCGQGRTASSSFRCCTCFWDTVPLTSWRAYRLVARELRRPFSLGE